jgi:HAD superfamily hydrolase (TIGR01490 family)
LLLLSRRGTDARAVASGGSLARASRMGARGSRSVGAGDGRVLLDSGRTCFVGRPALLCRDVDCVSENNCGRRAMSCEGNVGAFFDLDGTLLPRPSVERRFIFFLLMRGLIGPAQLARCAARFITNIAKNPNAAIGGNKAYLSGVSTGCVGEWSGQLASHPVKFFSDGRDRLKFHLAQGHRIFLITGAPAPLAEVVASYFSMPMAIIGTQLEVRDGSWTGEIAGEHMYGDAKQRAIVRLAAAYRLDLARSFAYGDSVSDLPMLETVGHPAAVNPSANLERAARARNWPVIYWGCWQGHWRGRWCERWRRRSWREAQSPRVETSRDAVQALRGVHASFTQSISCRGTNR